MPPFLALLAVLQASGLPAEHVRIPTQAGVVLDVALIRPAGPARGPAVVALHGCGGPYPSRDGSWAVTLAHAGHVVLLPDSFGSRGLGSQCREKERRVRASRERQADAVAAAQWLAARPGLPASGIALMGWSNGGTTVLAAARDRNRATSAPFSRFVAFYPGCAATARDTSWQPVAPVLILVGEADEWTPAAPCRDLAARFPGQITLVTYPGAYHDFDAPNQPVRQRTGLATAPNGRARVGTDPAARKNALTRVPAFLDTTN